MDVYIDIECKSEPPTIAYAPATRRPGPTILVDWTGDVVMDRNSFI